MSGLKPVDHTQPSHQKQGGEVAVQAAAGQDKNGDSSTDDKSIRTEKNLKENKVC